MPGSSSRRGPRLELIRNPVPSFIDQFEVLLLDMNGTFMFGHDRFGPEEDYFATYRALGGRRLDRTGLTAVLAPTLAEVLAVYDNPAHVDDFPSLAEAFRRYGHAEDADIPILERIFAAHELGRVPPEHQTFLRQVARTHRLGVVSNLCSHPDLWLSEHPDAETFRLFTALVYSSEGRSIKPSPALFRRALSHFPGTAAIVLIGDSLDRDVIPAKALGLSTVWIAPSGSAHPAADRVVERLPDLARPHQSAEE